VPRSKNAWSYTSTPQYAFMAWCSVKAQGRLYLYLYLMPKPPSTEIQGMCNIKCFVIPVITGATGIVIKGLKYL
jgi:hypothetical protein